SRQRRTGPTLMIPNRHQLCAAALIGAGATSKLRLTQPWETANRSAHRLWRGRQQEIGWAFPGNYAIGARSGELVAEPELATVAGPDADIAASIAPSPELFLSKSRSSLLFASQKSAKKTTPHTSAQKNPWWLTSSGNNFFSNSHTASKEGGTSIIAHPHNPYQKLSHHCVPSDRFPSFSRLHAQATLAMQ